MFINRIPFQPDYHTILSRLGYKKRTAEVSESFLSEVRAYIEDASDLITLKASAARFKITEKTEETVTLMIPPGTFSVSDREAELPPKDSFTINSRYLSRFLKDSNEVLLMGITGGKDIMDAVEEYQKSDMTKAVVIDAAAGEIVDSGLDYVMSRYSRELLRESKKLLSKRFSPGYGDLSLEIQKVIYDILNLEKLGITLTDSYLMIPQKSVIAITGII